MKINPNLSGMGNVLELINSANPGRNFTFAQVAVKSVATNTTPDIPYNTVAVMTGKAGGPYRNDQTVYYNRRPVTEAVEDPTVSYRVDETTTLAELVENVSKALKIVSTEVELVDFKTERDSSISTMVLKPTPNSLLYTHSFEITLIWLGEGVEEAVTILWAADELDRLINVTMPSRGYLKEQS
jgi:hypothetical protein